MNKGEKIKKGKDNKNHKIDKIKTTIKKFFSSKIVDKKKRRQKIQ